MRSRCLCSFIHFLGLLLRSLNFGAGLMGEVCIRFISYLKSDDLDFLLNWHS